MLPAPASSSVATSAPILIAFNTSMDPGAVERRLRITARRLHRLGPATLPGCSLRRAAAGQPTGCHFAWGAGDRVLRLLHPGHPFAVAATYRVLLLGGVRSAAGGVNGLAHAWTFVTEPAPVVTAVTPGLGSSLDPLAAPTVTFNRPMAAAATASAITLRPGPPGGITVLPSRRNAARFLVEPADPLTPGVRYTLTVSRRARDAHGNRLAHGLRVTFTAGAFGHSPAVVFRAGPPGAGALAVLAATAPAAPGDPPSLRQLYRAPAGVPIVADWPSPSGAWLAVELAGRPLQVVASSGGQPAVAVPDSAGVTGAAWSPGSHRLAFVAHGTLHLYTRSTGQVATVATADPVTGGLAWRPDGALIATTVRLPSGLTRIALLSPALQALSFLPPAGGGADQSAPVWSPDGATLAFQVSDPLGPQLWLYRPGDAAVPTTRLPGVRGTPVAFLDPSTVLLTTESGGLARTDLSTGTVAPLVAAPPAGPPLAAAVTVADRQVAYTALRHGYGQILLVNSDGTGAVDLTDFGPALPWSAGPPAVTGS